MKITINRDDIVGMFRSLYNVPSDTEFVIDVGPALYETIAEKMSDLPASNPSNKIARIKRLREVYLELTKGVLGLADAKHAIENFDRFLEFVKVNNRWPVAGYIKSKPDSYEYELNLR